MVGFGIRLPNTHITTNKKNLLANGALPPTRRPTTTVGRELPASRRYGHRRQAVRGSSCGAVCVHGAVSTSIIYALMVRYNVRDVS